MILWNYELISQSYTIRILCMMYVMCSPPDHRWVTRRDSVVSNPMPCCTAWMLTCIRLKLPRPPIQYRVNAVVLPGHHCWTRLMNFIDVGIDQLQPSSQNSFIFCIILFIFSFYFIPSSQKHTIPMQGRVLNITSQVKITALDHPNAITWCVQFCLIIFLIIIWPNQMWYNGNLLY